MMTRSTPNRGYPFPEGKDAAVVPVDMERSLGRVDADVQTLVDRAGDTARTVASAQDAAAEAARAAETAERSVTDVAALEPRVAALESAGAAAPSTPEDGQTATLVATEGTLTRAAVEDVVSAAVASVDALAATRVPTTVAPVPELGLSLPVQAARSSAGLWSHTVNPKTRHTQRGGPTFYVSPSGSNANDGLTPQTAFRDAFYASRKNGMEAAEIVVSAGVYERIQSLTVIHRAGLTVRAAGDGPVIFTACDRLQWSTGAGGVSTGDVANCVGVLDAGRLDVHGQPDMLTQVSTPSEVEAQPGTWALVSGTVHVHLRDGRPADANVLVSRPVNSLNFDASLAGATNGSVYFEGIQWWGGTTANLTAPGDGWRVLATDCQWNYAGSTNGVSVRGIAEVQLLQCGAHGNKLDGFNYHNHSDGRSGEVVEAECSGRGNGWEPGSNNGSTAHDTYQVFRVDCHYSDNTGANIAEVNSAVSQNVGCTGARSTGYEQDFYTDSVMWLDSCMSLSPKGITAATGGVIHTRDTVAAYPPVGDVVPW